MSQPNEVWRILYTRQIRKINVHAYKNFIKGLNQLGFSENEGPEFPELNRRLLEVSGWQVYAVPGLIPNTDFFSAMAERRFGATTWLRKMEELDYLEEPDMFHDVFGHVPLLCDPVISEFLKKLADLAVKYIDNEEVIEAIARLYWYTVEFGLVKEGSAIRIYGAGILSSIGETDFCMSADANRVPFNLDTILETPYIKDDYQAQYFVLESLEQLSEIIPALAIYFQILSTLTK